MPIYFENVGTEINDHFESANKVVQNVNYLLIIHPGSKTALEALATNFQATHGVDGKIAVIPCSLHGSPGEYSLLRGHELAERVMRPSVRGTDLLKLDQTAIVNFMGADWTNAVPWKLLFRSVPYASLSLCIAAASTDAREKMETVLADQIGAEAESFGASQKGDLLIIAKSVLEAWSA